MPDLAEILESGRGDVEVLRVNGLKGLNLRLRGMPKKRTPNLLQISGRDDHVVCVYAQRVQSRASANWGQWESLRSRLFEPGDLSSESRARLLAMHRPPTKFWSKLRKAVSVPARQAILKGPTDALQIRAGGECAGSGPAKVNSKLAVASKTFLSGAQRLIRSGHADAALDLLYDAVDERMRIGEFEQLDAILSGVQPAHFAVDILLGILTATLPARGRLPSRKALCERIEQTLKDRGEYEPGLLAGLEG
jgi:hypothetical protein